MILEDLSEGKFMAFSTLYLEKIIIRKVVRIPLTRFRLIGGHMDKVRIEYKYIFQKKIFNKSYRISERIHTKGNLPIR